MFSEKKKNVSFMNMRNKKNILQSEIKNDKENENENEKIFDSISSSIKNITDIAKIISKKKNKLNSVENDKELINNSNESNDLNENFNIKSLLQETLENDPFTEYDEELVELIKTHKSKILNRSIEEKREDDDECLVLCNSILEKYESIYYDAKQNKIFNKVDNEIDKLMNQLNENDNINSVSEHFSKLLENLKIDNMEDQDCKNENDENDLLKKITNSLSGILNNNDNENNNIDIEDLDLEQKSNNVTKLLSNLTESLSDVLNNDNSDDENDDDDDDEIKNLLATLEKSLKSTNF